jgi:DNA processing protein
MKIQKINITSPVFPANLNNIASPPKSLYCLGNVALLDKHPKLSVVGSRKITHYGKQVTSQLSREAAERSIVIVSGLALGIDAIAHESALKAKGDTIAVMPCGLDTIAPSTNRDLARRILAENGLLVSEYPEGTPPMRQNFIARNRIVSGICDALLVTEAAEKSGTLHTTAFALEQGKTVMAVPGNITSAQSAGTNNLIKSGALAVTNSSDICLALGISPHKDRVKISADSPQEAAIIELLEAGISDSGEILQLSKMNATVFNQTLTMMELAGKIHPLGAGHWGMG